jgi:hypothetical protein
MESQSPRGAATADDFAFARNVYVETMRWIVERLFGWDQVKINPARHFYKKQLAIEVARLTEPPRFISRANLLHWPPPDPASRGLERRFLPMGVGVAQRWALHGAKRCHTKHAWQR